MKAGEVKDLAVLALVVGGGFLLVRALGGIGRKYDEALDTAANWYVDRTHPGVQIAGGITYVLPNGQRVAASAVKPASGALFDYQGVRYRLVAADPPGSGNYKAVRA